MTRLSLPCRALTSARGPASVLSLSFPRKNQAAHANIVALGQFDFVTEWRFVAPIGVVWEIVARPEVWPLWWRGVLQAKLIRQGTDDGHGFVYAYVWRSILPYKLAFNLEVTQIEPQRTLQGKASGEVEGSGRWEFQREGETTVVRYYWNIRLTRFWPALVASMTAPIVRWNHDVVMEWGRRGLMRRLQAENADARVPLANAHDDAGLP